MGVLMLIFVTLLLGSPASGVITRQPYTMTESGDVVSTHEQDCGEGRLLLVTDIRVMFMGPPCCSSKGLCPFWPRPADFAEYLADCRNTSRCRLSIRPQPCGEKDADPLYTRLDFECSSAPAVLAMDRPGSTSGRTVAASFSSPDLQSSNSSWQCRVEASDNSRLNSTVQLYIRNTERQSSSFFSMENVERLGGHSLQRRGTASFTPFSVTLHLVAGSRVQPAYVLVTANKNITITCGRREVMPPTSFLVASPAEQQQQQSRTSVVGPAVGGAVAALVVIAVVVVIIVFGWRNRTGKKTAGGGIGEGRFPGSRAQICKAADDVTQRWDEHIYELDENLYMAPQPLSSAGNDVRTTSPPNQNYYSIGERGVPSNAERPYEPLDQATKDDVTVAAPYQELKPASISDGDGGKGVPSDVTNTYECLDDVARDYVSMATPCQRLRPAATSIRETGAPGAVSAAYERLDQDSRRDASPATPYQELRSAPTCVKDVGVSGEVGNVYESLEQEF